MTKRQMFLIAGTILLAACPPGFTAPEVCEENDDSGWTECSAIQIAQPAETPSASVGADESDLRQARKASRRPLW